MRLIDEWGADLAGVAIAWIVSLLAVIAFAAEPYEASGVRVIDGDTIHVDALHLGWDHWLHDQTIRAAGYDAWESNRQRFGAETAEDEIAKGKAATADLLELLAAGGLRVVPPSGKSHGVYGRLVGRLIVLRDGDRVEVSEWMRERGHCR